MDRRYARATSENIKFTVIGKHYAVSFISSIPRGHASSLSPLKSKSANFIANWPQHKPYMRKHSVTHFFLCDSDGEERQHGVFTFQRFTETHCLLIKSSISSHSRTDGCLLPAPKYTVPTPFTSVGFLV